MIDEHEVYVKRETAGLLNKAGYNWTTPQGYLSSSGLLTSGHFSNNSDYGVAAPTLDVAQRWLRDVKNIEVIVEWYVTFDGIINPFEKRKYEYNTQGPINMPHICFSKGGYDTYEEAQESGIINALKELINGQNS